jgi:hypothetical protein
MERSIRVAALAALSMVLLMTGCASNHKMALVKGQDTVDVSKGSVGLLSLRVSNQFKTGCQPKMFAVGFVQNMFPKGSKFVARGWDMEAPYRSEKNGFNEYLLTLALEPGTYDFINLYGSYNIPLLISGTTWLFLQTELEVRPNSVIYLGHIEAVIRERKSKDEVRAGPVLPLIDQSTPGFSGGTYDVSFQDRFDEDIKVFVSEYPGLQKVKIEKSVIPSSTKVIDNPF